MKRTEISLDKLEMIKESLEAWGDRCVYIVAKEHMPPDGEAYVMQRLSYSTQPMTIKRLADGSGQIELFYSRGD